ncbi:MAG: transposase [Bacillota bacterium]
MPRQARQSSETGIYHIMLRGINRQSIFEDDHDREKFLQVINKYKEISMYQVFGYCLMDNHIHLLLKEGKEPLATTMKRIGGCYVYWYNMKYERCGHLFQDRYKSEPVEDDNYLLNVLRYIHQNPLKAKLVNHIQEYRWSSYGEYLSEKRIIESAVIFDILSSEGISKAKGIFVDFMVQSDDSSFLDINEKKKITDKEAKELIVNHGNINTAELHKLDRDKRDEVLKKLKKIQGLSTRQIARLTGISQSVISRA